MAYRASGHYDRPFRARCGVTQGRPLSPTIFNLVVDAIVREWVRGLWEEHDLGFEDVRQLLACFYADDALVVARNPEHLQITCGVLITLFDQVGLETNTTKAEAMVFLPGRIRTPLTAEAYGARMVDTFREEKVGRKVTCPLCPDVLASGSLRSHLATQHDAKPCFLIKDLQRGPLLSPT